MDVRLSPEQHALRDSAAQVVDRLGPHAVGALADGERRRKLVAAVTASGWRELRAGDQAGRPWASAVEAAIVAEELARGLADAPFLGPTLAADLRRLVGAAAPAAPETVVLTADLGALARTPAGVAIDASGAATALCLDGPQLVAIRCSGGPGDTDPYRLAPQNHDGDLGVDLTRSTVVVSDADPEVLAPIDDDAIARWTALGLAVTAAELVGTMRGAVRLACDHALARRQFGTPVGSFQAVQHLLADAHVAMEGARSAALHAAWAVDALPPGDAVAAGAIAKAYAARAARSVCETAIQVHGGIGNTWDCLAHVHLRRALLSTDVLGGTGPNLARVLAHQGIGAADGLR